MLALVASLFLGAYFLLPVLVFDKTLAFFVPAKRYTRTRTEEFASGAFVILLPLLVTTALSQHTWIVGHYPFSLNESSQQDSASDYHVVTMALSSDHYAELHEKEVWTAERHIKKRQARFLVWMYALLLLECSAVILIVRKYGAWRKYPVYRLISRPFVVRVSPWHILFTAYTFDPKEKRMVHVDVLSSGELYTGILGEEHYLVNPDGSLNGLLLTQTKRFKRKALEEDRLKGPVKDESEYWSPVPGDGQFYIPSATIANVNIRFRKPEPILKQELAAFVQQLLANEKSTIKISFNSPPV